MGWAFTQCVIKSILSSIQEANEMSSYSLTHRQRSFVLKSLLLDAKVSVHQVSPVINAVGDLCGKSFSSLPSVTTINRINDRRASIAREQLSNVSNERNTTLLSDETRNYGDTYETFCLNTSNKEYILGVREMADKSANSCLDTLGEVVEDINISSSSTPGNDIIFNIKNTMSDRAPTSDTDKNEAVKFVRMAWKCFARCDDEKNGIYKDLNTYLQRNENPNKWKNLLTPFKGNRFKSLQVKVIFPQNG